MSRTPSRTAGPPWLAPALAALALTAVAAAAPPPAAAQQAAASPHGELSLPCSDCHTTEGWRPLADPRPFDHAGTGFPLVGSHRGVACLDCHGDLRFARVAAACADCHRDPHRGELGLACESCHQPHGWDEARRQMADLHAATLFPLTGAHAAVDCAGCHRGAPPLEFAATPTDCFACHADDFRATRDPDHQRSGFPTTCESCHNTIDWEMADFRAHDTLFFPIFSGPHAGEWGACSDCHTTPSDFSRFSCLNCHAHRRGEMDDEHDDVRGYAYQSDACLSCHPQGRE
jgi:hypothetical protein